MSVNRITTRSQARINAPMPPPRHGSAATTAALYGNVPVASPVIIATRGRPLTRPITRGVGGIQTSRFLPTVPPRTTTVVVRPRVPPRNRPATITQNVVLPLPPPIFPASLLGNKINQAINSGTVPANIENFELGREMKTPPPVLPKHDDEYVLIDLTNSPAQGTTRSPENIAAPMTNEEKLVFDNLAAGAASLAIDTYRKKSIVTMSEQIQLMWTVDVCDCCFCGINLKPMEGVMLNWCLHPYCKNCLVSAIQFQNDVQIKCPLNDGSPIGCDGILLEKEIKALVSPEVYQQYIERSMLQARQNMNIFECKSPNCGGWCEVGTGTKNFHCFLCSAINCLECMAVHEGVNCKEYQKYLQQAGSPEAADKLMKKGCQNGWEQLQLIMQDYNGDLENGFQELEIFSSKLEFDCPICMTEVEKGNGIILQDCLHMFCKECMVQLIQHSDEAEVKCPHLDANHSCTNNLKPREIKALMPPDLLEKHLQVSVKLAENGMVNSYHCKTPDCPGWCELENVEGQAPVFYDCQVCFKRNCLKCNVIHKGTCEDYKNSLVQNKNDKLSEEALQKEVASGVCMKCPKCNAVLQKIVGCDWIVCSRCRTEICWATKGPRWGPKGRGDTSGGCKCDFKNGKPCTPTCKNCH